MDPTFFLDGCPVLLLGAKATGARLSPEQKWELERSIEAAVSRAWRLCSYRCDSSVRHDLENEAWLAALSDMRRYDPSRGKSLAAYCAPGIHIAIRSFLQRAGSAVSARRGFLKQLHGHHVVGIDDAPDDVLTAPADARADFDGWQDELAARLRELVKGNPRLRPGLEAIVRGEKPQGFAARIGVPYQEGKRLLDRAKAVLRGDEDLRDVWSEVLPLDGATAARITRAMSRVIGVRTIREALQLALPPLACGEPFKVKARARREWAKW